MARANFVKSARRDYPEHGIKKGESYWWWQLYKQPKRFSKERPRQSQLTGSEFLSTCYGYQETLEDMTAESMDDLESQISELASEMEAYADQQREKKDNMPESLQDSDIGQLLEERADGLSDWASELQNLDYQFDEDEYEDEEEKEQALQDRIQEVIQEAIDLDPGLN